MNGQDGSEPVESCDVLVIGGGPAGSTVSALLARRGWSVVMLEKAQHPRFHIGESLLPMNLPIFERLGVLDKVRALGVHKPGADFESDAGQAYSCFDFSRALGQSPAHAFQVCRAEFDQMLFEHARQTGVDARQGHKVVAVEHKGPRAAEALVEVEGQEPPLRIRARYVIDASGRDALLSQRRKLMRRNRQHQSAAIFGRFNNARFREGDDRGNISIYWFEHGWMWLIPQPGGEMSVGAVCRPAYLRRRRGNNRDFLLQTLQANAAAWARLEQAELIDDKVHVAGNYTYDSSCMGGPGWMLIGDAFAFLDPVFSSGVYLAMTGAERAASVVDEALRHPEREAVLQKRLETHMRRGMRHFAWFIYRFNSPAMRRLFNGPRNVLDIERGVISMLAGDVFDNRRVLRKLRLFQMLYAIVWLAHPLASWRERRERHLQARSVPD